MRTRTLSVGDLHCQGCESIVEQAVAILPGVSKAKADYGSGTLDVTFDPKQTDPRRIALAVIKAGYSCTTGHRKDSRWRAFNHVLLVLLALGAIGALLAYGAPLAGRFHPKLEQGMSYGLLFLVGVLTGFHCIGMCGGFVVGYSARYAARSGRTPLMAHVQYGLGKTLSYTVIGGGFGLLGSVIAFTPQIRGYAAIVAGAFLVLFGINMLDWFRCLHRVGLRMPKFLARFVSMEAKKHPGPLSIGLLNGLMIACGPLQALYVMAAGTGDFAEGATMLLVFGLGTLPVMLGFGMLTGMVSGRITHNLLKASALLVVALGLIMLNRGLLLAGTGYDFQSLRVLAESRVAHLQADLAELSEPGHQTIRMTLDHEGFSPNQFALRQGVPVRWIIDAQEVTECNRRITVPALGLEFDVHPGENRIEFTPRKSGFIAWSCWMGMIHGSFVVEPPPVLEENEASGEPPLTRAARVLRELAGRLR